jgi:hypothetical protein
MELGLQPARSSQVPYYRGLATLLGAPTAVIPDKSLLSEDMIRRNFRDYNGIDEKLRNIYSYTVSQQLKTAVLNEFHGMPILLGCTEVHISHATKWQQGGADIEQVCVVVLLPPPLDHRRWHGTRSALPVLLAALRGTAGRRRANRRATR